MSIVKSNAIFFAKLVFANIRLYWDHQTSILYLHIESYWVLILSTVYVHSTDSVVLRIAVSLGFGTKPLTWPCQVPNRDDDVLQHLYFYNVFLGMSHLGVRKKMKPY